MTAKQLTLMSQLGIGSIGTLISHHLRLANPDAPISLIVRSARAFPSTSLHPRGTAEHHAIKLSVTRSDHTTTSTGFDQEIYNTRQDHSAEDNDQDAPNGPIRSLIVCLKTPNTLSALSLLKHRIAPDSVIALLQNGMGVYDEVCDKIWPEPATRPFFMLGTTTHGATPASVRGQIKHNSREGEGDIKWGLVPDPRKEVDLEQWIFGGSVSDSPVLSPPSSPNLPLPSPPVSSHGSTSSWTDLSNVHATVSALLSLDRLNSTLLPMPHLHHNLLLKLALNANINPLTAILGAGSLPNGSLIGSSPSHRLIRMLSGETSSIISSYLNNLYAPRTPPAEVMRLYTQDALVTRTLALCHATARNSSSMAVDAASGRMTEIDFINGYLISLAERMNIPTPHHQMVREMVKFTAEVTGLQKETRMPTRARVARKQQGIAGKLLDSQSQKPDKDDKENLPEEDLLKAQLREERRIRRRGLRAMRKELAGGKADTDRIKPARPHRGGKAQSGRQQKRGNEPPVDSQATAAHLDDPSRSNSVSASPQQDVSTPQRRNDEITEDSTEPAEEEPDEAVKALEDRLFSGRGRRGF